MENQSIQSMIKMVKTSHKSCGNASSDRIDELTEDLMRNIFSRLPRITFARAACVNRSWNSLCKHFLTSPKISSAVSVDSSLEIAVNEVLDKVLSGPVLPNFAIASIGSGSSFSLERAHQLIGERLGSGVPLLTTVSEGIIGKDVRTNNFVEAKCKYRGEEFKNEEIIKHGIILTVGFLPGLKAHIVPLFLGETVDYLTMGPEALFIDDMVMNIRRYVADVSESESPLGIMLFGQFPTLMKSILQMMEFAFPLEMTIVGGVYSKFLYNSNVNATISRPKCIAIAAALVFVKDKNKGLDIGETNFHVILSPGLSPVGLTYKALSVACNSVTATLTATRQTLNEDLYINGPTILKEIKDEVGVGFQGRTYYIGVTKRRNCSLGEEEDRQLQFLEFHLSYGAFMEDLFVNSSDIKTGDPFWFYFPNSELAALSCKSVSDKLKILKEESSSTRTKVFGCIMFSCHHRGSSFLGQTGGDSSLFLDNFPGVAFGGTYCVGEIARGNSSVYYPGLEEDGRSISCSEHFFSSVYLVMSYCPKPAVQHSVE